MQVEETEPSPESLQTMALTQPYHVVVVKRSPLSVRFRRRTAQDEQAPVQQMLEICRCRCYSVEYATAHESPQWPHDRPSTNRA